MVTRTCNQLGELEIETYQHCDSLYTGIHSVSVPAKSRLPFWCLSRHRRNSVLLSDTCHAGTTTTTTAAVAAVAAAATTGYTFM